MRKLKYLDRLNAVPSDYLEDSLRIQRALRNAGYEVSLSEAYRMWDERSDDWCAGWLNLPDTDEEIIQDLTEEDD